MRSLNQRVLSPSRGSARRPPPAAAADNAAKLSYICIAFVRDRKNGCGHYCCYSLINYKHPFERHARGRGRARHDAAEYGSPGAEKKKTLIIHLRIIVGINLIRNFS